MKSFLSPKAPMQRPLLTFPPTWTSSTLTESSCHRLLAYSDTDFCIFHHICLSGANIRCVSVPVQCISFINRHSLSLPCYFTAAFAVDILDGIGQGGLRLVCCLSRHALACFAYVIDMWKLTYLNPVTMTCARPQSWNNVVRKQKGRGLCYPLYQSQKVI